MSETCWAHKKWNKIASDIKLVFHSSTITMSHDPINIRFKRLKYLYKRKSLEHLLCIHAGVLTENFNVCANVWLCFLPTYFATDHFEGATLASERTARWWHLERAETCNRFSAVWCVYSVVHVKLVILVDKTDFMSQRRRCASRETSLASPPHTRLWVLWTV